MSHRRSFLQGTAAWSAGLFAAGEAATANSRFQLYGSNAQVGAHGGYLGVSSGSLSKIEPRGLEGTTKPVITPDVGDLSFELEGDIKVFRLTAHVFKQQIAPDKTIDVWGFNGSAPGPTIQVTQGDQIRVIFKNELPEPSSIHWHGFEDQIGYDGMPGISQEPVKPGETFVYNFTIKQEGTYFYHSHMAMQELAGMLGAVIMHPKVPYEPHCEKDFVIHLQEYAVRANSTTPDTMMMEFNWLLLNGRAGPATTPLIVKQGERVRIRFINLGMDHHPMHVHGHTFYVTGTEGGRIAESAWWPGNTVLVGVAQSRNVEFVADNPGDWMLHCHLPHHMMNQMASQVGPMTRMSGSSGSSKGSRGDDSQVHMAGPEQMGHMPEMETSSADGMRMTGHMNPSVLPDSAVPSAALAAGAEAMSPRGPLANTGLDPGMAGMMHEQAGHRHLVLSPLQKRNLEAFDMGSDSMKAQMSDTSPDANNVPNFPQDAYMEGPMMNMDKLVDKPENLGLRAHWSRFVQGMMTFVRVLPPEQYDRVVAAMQNANRERDPYSTLYATSVHRKRG